MVVGAILGLVTSEPRFFLFGIEVVCLFGCCCGLEWLISYAKIQSQNVGRVGKSRQLKGEENYGFTILGRFLTVTSRQSHPIQPRDFHGRDNGKPILFPSETSRSPEIR